MWQLTHRAGCIALAFALCAGAITPVEAATKKTTSSRSSKSAKAKKKTSSRTAKAKSSKSKSRATAKARTVKKAPEAPKPPYQAYIVVEAETGKVITEKQADRSWQPASLAKMMLTLIVMEHIAEGKIALDTPVKASAYASSIGGSQVYLKQGETHSLESMMQAIEIASANDACVAVAEAVAGTDSAMVELMNARAKSLGMGNTRYVNVHGLPPDAGKPDNVTTARDTSILARELVTRFPKLLEWTSTVEAPFRDGKFKLYSTNHSFLRNFPGADGLKTGYHSGSGFNLVATANRNGVRLISVVLGSPSPAVRANETMALLSNGYATHERRVVLKSGEAMSDLLYVEKSEHQYVPLKAGSDLTVFANKTDFSRVRLSLESVAELTAPVEDGFPAGTIVATLDGKRVGSVAAVVSQDVPKARFLWSFWNWRTPKPTVEEFLELRQAGMNAPTSF